jgi:hypothetical protein
LSFLVVVAIRPQGPGEIEVVEAHVGVSVVSSEPVHNILFFKIGAKIEFQEENSQIVNINLSMGILINSSEDFY